MAGEISTVDASALEAEHASLAAQHVSLAAEHTALAAAHAVLVGEHAALQVVVDAIKVVTDSLSVLTETGGTLTTDGGEQNVYINNAPSGIYRPVCVKIDFTAHTAGETVVVRAYYRIKSGGGYILQDEDTYAGLVSPELINVTLEPNRYGVKVTMEKTVGANRAYDWEAVYES